MQIKDLIVVTLFLVAQAASWMALHNEKERSAALEQCLKAQDSRACYRNLFNNVGK